MLRPEDVVRLKHMLDHAREAVELVCDKVRRDLDSNRMLCLALIRLIEIVGEAAGRISADVRNRHSTIPWPQIISLRNRLIHGYDSVDMDILWQILKEDLPVIVIELEKLINQEVIG
jgi:uncharacterized protein with HEPN domain